MGHRPILARATGFPIGLHKLLLAAHKIGEDPSILLLPTGSSREIPLSPPALEKFPSHEVLK